MMAGFLHKQELPATTYALTAFRQSTNAQRLLLFMGLL